MHSLFKRGVSASGLRVHCSRRLEGALKILLRESNAVGLKEEDCLLCHLECIRVNLKSQGVRGKAQDFSDCEVCEASLSVGGVVQ